MNQTRPKGVLSTRRIPVLRRPRVLTVDAARREGAGGRVGSAGRRWRWANRRNFERSLADMARFEAGELPLLGQLWLAKVGRDGFTDLGLASCRVVTNAGVNFIVDAFQGLVEPETMRFHGVGTGTTAEAATQTALVTELTTQYSTNSTRPSGTLGEDTANTFETVATITVDAAVGITEHGLFSQAAVPGGVMLDRSVFSAVNLANGESLQATYRLTFPSGG